MYSPGLTAETAVHAHFLAHTFRRVPEVVLNSLQLPQVNDTEVSLYRLIYGPVVLSKLRSAFRGIQDSIWVAL